MKKLITSIAIAAAVATPVGANDDGPGADDENA
jgi:hypothetical protein